MKPNFKSAFSVFEILMVVAIMSILSTVVFSSLTTSRQTQILNSETEKAFSILTDARGKTLASIDSSQYGVHFATDSITLFKGSSYNSSDPENQETDLNPAVEIANICLDGGGANIIFNRLTGATSQSGTFSVRLEADTSKTKTIIVSASGLIDG